MIRAGGSVRPHPRQPPSPAWGTYHPAVRTHRGGDLVAVVPRAAATVALLRDGRDGLEAYLQLRPARMGFAGGLWVFPGGRVDEADADPAVEATWAGPP